MCARSMPAPPAPEPVKLPEAPQIPNVVAPTITQSTPAAPEAQSLFKRRGKRALTIQMGSTAGTKIPGA